MPFRSFGRGRGAPDPGRGSSRGSTVAPGSRLEALYWRQPCIPAEAWQTQQIRTASSALSARMSLEASERHLERPNTADDQTCWHYRVSLVVSEQQLSYIGRQTAACLSSVGTNLATELNSAISTARCESDDPEMDPTGRLSLVIFHYEQGLLAANQLQALEQLVSGLPSLVVKGFAENAASATLTAGFGVHLGAICRSAGACQPAACSSTGTGSALASECCLRVSVTRDVKQRSETVQASSKRPWYSSDYLVAGRSTAQRLGCAPA